MELSSWGWGLGKYVEKDNYGVRAIRCHQGEEF
jgi:hypothetical protein